MEGLHGGTVDGKEKIKPDSGRCFRCGLCCVRYYVEFPLKMGGYFKKDMGKVCKFLKWDNEGVATCEIWNDGIPSSCKNFMNEFKVCPIGKRVRELGLTPSEIVNHGGFFSQIELVILNM